LQVNPMPLTSCGFKVSKSCIVQQVFSFFSLEIGKSSLLEYMITSVFNREHVRPGNMDMNTKTFFCFLTFLIVEFLKWKQYIHNLHNDKLNEEGNDATNLMEKDTRSSRIPAKFPWIQKVFRKTCFLLMTNPKYIRWLNVFSCLLTLVFCVEVIFNSFQDINEESSEMCIDNDDESKKYFGRIDKLLPIFPKIRDMSLWGRRVSPTFKTHAIHPEKLQENMASVKKLHREDVQRYYEDRVSFVGQGRYGEAYKIRYNNDYAVMKMAKNDESSVKSVFQNEQMYLNYLNGVGGAPKLLASCEDPAAIIMEFCSGEPLHICMKGYNVSTQNILRTFPEIARQLQKIHSLGVAHLDIKPDNVLVEMAKKNQAGAPKINIIDFGLSNLIGYSNPDNFKNTLEFPLGYRNGYASTARDIFSFGVLMNDVLNYRAIFSHVPITFRVLANAATVSDPSNLPTLNLLISLLDIAVYSMEKEEKNEEKEM
ncbi:hypothetical protein SK128_023076, partial [Halocaridina rubra]